jgi:LysR family glycine cleavage system transcriptional activator
LKRPNIPHHGKEPLARRLLPNSLTVFETVARLGSISAAASNLNVAASGVSRHIVNLEAQLSIELFVRNSGRLTLTADGHDLAETVREGLGLIQHRVTDIQMKRSGSVILGCDPDMATLFVMPRYGRIARQLDMNFFRMLTSNDYREFDDPSIDLSIRCGRPEDWPGFTATLLLELVGYAACAPSLLQQYPGLVDGSTEALMDAPLLHVGFHYDGLEGWSDWLGVDGPLRGPRLSSYQSVMQAAVEGHGVMIAWRGVVEDELVQAGRLVRLGEPRVARPAYYMVGRIPQRPIASLLAKLLLD